MVLYHSLMGCHVITCIFFRVGDEDAGQPSSKQSKQPVKSDANISVEVGNP